MTARCREQTKGRLGYTLFGSEILGICFLLLTPRRRDEHFVGQSVDNLAARRRDTLAQRPSAHTSYLELYALLRSKYEPELTHTGR